MAYTKECDNVCPGIISPHFGLCCPINGLHLRLLSVVWDAANIIQFISSMYITSWRPGGCFTNVSQALQNTLLKFVYCRYHTSYENFKLKLCTCAQSHALGTCTKIQLEILTINVISGIVYFWRAREMLVKQSPGLKKRDTTTYVSQQYIHKALWHYTVTMKNVLGVVNDIREYIEMFRMVVKAIWLQ